MRNKSTITRALLAFGVAGAMSLPVVAGSFSVNLNEQAIAVQTNDIILQNQPTDAALTVNTEVAVPVDTTVTLQVNGAKFNPSTPPELTTTGTLVVGVGVLNGDNTQAQWTVTTAGGIGDDLQFDLNTVQSTDLRGVAVGTDVTYTVTLNDGGAAIDDTPLTSDVAFNLVDAVSASIASNTDTAQVTTSYTQLQNIFDGDPADVEITNDTSDQDVTASNLVCAIRGDFTGITEVAAMNVTGSSATGVPTPALGKFTINTDKDAAYAVLAGTLAGGDSIDIDPVFTVDGLTSQTPRSFTFECDLLASGTFVAEAGIISPETSNIIVRNGFSFTTTLTGTTSSNEIVIRDLSNNLSGAGGAINVGVTFYDADGNGTTVAPVTLDQTLPNNGQARILAPDLSAEITSKSGTAVPDASFAIFNFAVETAAGEAAVKKQVPGVGIDIQQTTTSGVPAI